MGFWILALFIKLYFMRALWTSALQYWTVLTWHRVFRGVMREISFSCNSHRLSVYIAYLIRAYVSLCWGRSSAMDMVLWCWKFPIRVRAWAIINPIGPLRQLRQWRNLYRNIRVRFVSSKGARKIFTIWTSNLFIQYIVAVSFALNHGLFIPFLVGISITPPDVVTQV